MSKPVGATKASRFDQLGKLTNGHYIPPKSTFKFTKTEQCIMIEVNL